MSRLVSSVGQPQRRAADAVVRSENISTINITTANGSSITITGSHIEVEVQNVNTATNTGSGGARRNPSAKRPRNALPAPGDDNDNEPEANLDGDDAHTTVDWTPASDSLARQIEADRRARATSGAGSGSNNTGNGGSTGRTFPVGMPAPIPATPDYTNRPRATAGGGGEQGQSSRTGEGGKSLPTSRPSVVDRERERQTHVRKTSDPKAAALAHDSMQRRISPSQVDKVAYDPNDDVAAPVRPKRMSHSSAPRKTSGASADRLPNLREEATATQSVKPNPKASRAPAPDASSGPPNHPPAQPMQIPVRSSLASLRDRDDQSAVGSIRQHGSRFSELAFSDHVPPIVSTPPVRRPSLLAAVGGFHSDPAEYFPVSESGGPTTTQAPKPPSPYEREEVVVQNAQSSTTSTSYQQATSIHQRLAHSGIGNGTSAANPSGSRRNAVSSSEPTSNPNNTTITVEVVRRNQQPNEGSQSSAAASSLPTRGAPQSQILTSTTRQSQQQAVPVASNVAKKAPPLNHPTQLRQTDSTPNNVSGGQSTRQASAASLEPARNTTSNDSNSKSPTPSMSMPNLGASVPKGGSSVAAQVAQGFHPPSLLPGLLARSASSENQQPQQQQPSEQPSSRAAPSSRPAAASSNIMSPPLKLAIPKPAVNEQPRIPSPSSTDQEGSIAPSDSGRSHSRPPSRAPSRSRSQSKSRSQTTSQSQSQSQSQSSARIPYPPLPGAGDGGRPPTTTVSVPVETRPPPASRDPGRYQGPTRPTPAPQQQHSTRATEAEKLAQPMLKLVPMPGYASNEPSPISFSANATAANLERQVMQERERAILESMSRSNVMVPIEFRSPPTTEPQIRNAQPSSRKEPAAREVYIERPMQHPNAAPVRRITPSSNPSSSAAAGPSAPVRQSQPSTPSDKAQELPQYQQHQQHPKSVEYFKAITSPRHGSQTTTIEYRTLTGATRTQLPAASSTVEVHTMPNPSSHSAPKPPMQVPITNRQSEPTPSIAASSLVKSPAPFVVQNHPQNPWQGFSPIPSSNSSLEQQQSPGSGLPTPDDSPPRPPAQDAEEEALMPPPSSNLLGLFGVEPSHGLHRKPSKLEAGRAESVGVSTPPDTPRMMAMQSVPHYPF